MKNLEDQPAERLRASSDLMISSLLRVPSLAPDTLLESAVSQAIGPAPITFDVKPPPMGLLHGKPAGSKASGPLTVSP